MSTIKIATVATTAATAVIRVKTARKIDTYRDIDKRTNKREKERCKERRAIH